MKVKHLPISKLPNDTVLYSEYETVNGTINGHPYQALKTSTVTVKDCVDRNIIPLNVTEQVAKNMLYELYNL